MSELNEKIICAAIKLEDGRIFYGHRHHNCRDAKYDALSWTHNREQITKIKYEEGFITSQGRFVSREEALVIALQNNQVLDISEIRGDRLYSEDLY